MRLVDLEPVWLGFPYKPMIGIAFNCPGACCADRRRLQLVALEAERAAEPAKQASLAAGEGEWSHPEVAAAAARRAEAFANQPFRVFVVFEDRRALFEGKYVAVPGPKPRSAPDVQFEEWYARTGETLDDLSVARVVDRRQLGHVALHLERGEVTVEEEGNAQ